ncbi:MAG TPA: MbtH family NRPS accessory protein [Steroidobacteraceae bacterium]|jgi:MbtH protein|nr:MbtH family NRPS accessory protein [Steroidobacteraceae bacterium]
MGNPFEVETGGFLVLVNVEGQHSLWPAFHELQNGWPWIESQWTHTLPRSLAAEPPASKQ